MRRGVRSGARGATEEIDPRDGWLLGNFLQAFSHVGLITAAWAIDQASRGDTEMETGT